MEATSQEDLHLFVACKLFLFRCCGVFHANYDGLSHSQMLVSQWRRRRKRLAAYKPLHGANLPLAQELHSIPLRNSLHAADTLY